MFLKFKKHALIALRVFLSMKSVGNICEACRNMYGFSDV